VREKERGNLNVFVWVKTRIELENGSGYLYTQ